MPKEYFWDEYGITEKSNATLLPVTGTKDGIVLSPSKPYDSKRVEQGSAIYDRDGTVEVGEFTKAGRLHYWYWGLGGNILDRLQRDSVVGYAYSDDLGLTWVKPNLYNYDYVSTTEVYEITDKNTWVAKGDGGANNLAFVGRYQLGFTEDSTANLDDNKEYLASFQVIYDTLETDPAKRWKLLYMTSIGTWDRRNTFGAYSANGIKWTRYHVPLTSNDFIKSKVELVSGACIGHNGKYVFNFNSHIASADLNYTEDVRAVFHEEITNFFPPTTAYGQFTTQDKVLSFSTDTYKQFLGGKSARHPIDLTDGDEGEMQESQPSPTKDIWGDLYLHQVGMMYTPGANIIEGNAAKTTDITLFTIRGTQYDPAKFTRIGTKASHKIIKQGIVENKDFDCGMMFALQAITKNGDYPFIQTDTEDIWFYSGAPVDNSLAPLYEGAIDIMPTGRVKWRKDGLTKVDILPNGYVKTRPMPNNGLIKVNHKGDLKVEELNSSGQVIQSKIVVGDNLSADVFQVSSGNLLRLYNNTLNTVELYSYELDPTAATITPQPQFPTFKPTIVDKGLISELTIDIKNLISSDKVIVERATIPEGQSTKAWSYFSDAKLVSGTLLSGTWKVDIDEKKYIGDHFFRFKVVR